MDKNKRKANVSGLNYAQLLELYVDVIQKLDSYRPSSVYRLQRDFKTHINNYNEWGKKLVKQPQHTKFDFESTWIGYYMNLATGQGQTERRVDSLPVTATTNPPTLVTDFEPPLEFEPYRRNYIEYPRVDYIPSGAVTPDITPLEHDEDAVQVTRRLSGAVYPF